MAFYKGWRYAAFLSGIVGFIGLAMYPIAIAPMMDPSEYKKIQKEARKNIRQEDVQPGTDIACWGRVGRLLHSGWPWHDLCPPDRHNSCQGGRTDTTGQSRTTGQSWSTRRTGTNILSDTTGQSSTTRWTNNDMKVWTDPFGRKKPESEG